MKHSTQPPAPVGKTRWRRFGAAAGVGFGLVGVLGYLAMSGALALSFAFSGIPFQLSASEIRGEHFVQYAYPDKLATGTPLPEALASKLIGTKINNVETTAGGPIVSDTVTQMKSAAIEDLKQTICAPIAPGAPLAIRVHIVSTATTSADNLTIQAPALTASSARFERIVIGETVRDALRDQGFGPGEFTDPYDALEPGNPLGDSFGQGADRVTLTNIQQVGIGTEAGLFTIGGLKLWAEFVGTEQCTEIAR